MTCKNRPRYDLECVWWDVKPCSINQSDALATLHWLRIPERVQYNIAVLTFKVLHDSAPRYLRPLVAVADLPGRRALRSATTSRLVAPPFKLSTVGSRAFPVVAAQVWNGLSEAVVSSSSLQTFHRQLRTHLVQLSTFIPSPDF